MICIIALNFISFKYLNYQNINILTIAIALIVITAPGQSTSTAVRKSQRRFGSPHVLRTHKGA